MKNTKSHTVRKVLKYHTVGKVPKYHTVGKVLKYHTVVYQYKKWNKVKVIILTAQTVW
jgi:hypothetical protein